MTNPSISRRRLVWISFLGFVKKEFRHILRDRRTLMILFGMPLIQMAIFGFAIRNDLQDIPLMVVDESGDEHARALIERFGASDYFTIVGFAASSTEVEGLMSMGTVRQALVIPPHFARALTAGGAQVQLITDSSDPNLASTMLAYASAIISSYQTELSSRGNRIGIAVESRMRYNPELSSAFLFVPGLIALILMLVCALMTSITITREKELGTMEVLLVSPLRPMTIVVGKVIPYVVLSLLNLFTILALARFVFDVPIRGSLPLLLAECLLFILCALSLGILISSLSSTQQTAMMISLAGLLLPTVILSGFIFPISSMPAPLQIVSHAVPAKWFLLITRGIMIKGLGLSELLKPTLVLAGMTSFFLVIAIRNFSERLEGT